MDIIKKLILGQSRAFRNIINITYMIFSKSKKRRGCIYKRGKVYEAQVGLFGKANYVGRFKTKKAAQEGIDKYLMHHEA